MSRILAPVEPTSIICIGLNYRKHAEETVAKFPGVSGKSFFKGINTLQHPGEPIQIPTHLPSDEVDYECELGVVIGRVCKNVSRADALNYVLGYTCCNDVSARDWQIKRGGSQWSRGKSFDTFSPLGPVLVTRDEIPNPNALSIRTVLNGQIMQDWNTNDMIFDASPNTDRVSQQQHHVATGDRDSHRNSAWRRHGAKTAALAQTGRYRQH